MAQVYLSGGIGNQLFQAGYAHYLNYRFGFSPIVKKLKLVSGLPHTNICFFPDDYICKHCTYRIDVGDVRWNEVSNPWREKRRLLSLRKRIDLRAQPFLTASAINSLGKKGVWLGYFQNQEFIRPIQDVFRTEILKVIEMRSRSGQACHDSEEIEVIHVRQVDTKSPANMRRVGVLDNAYYKRNLTTVSDYRNRLVVTDDVQGALRVLNGIKFDEIYGPDDLDEWETLSLMGRSKRLITANSTFSWWGGFLTVANGGQVVIPRPFFISAELQTNGAFKYPGFTESVSSFLV